MQTPELATPAISRFQWDWAALNSFGDLRVRYGIKVGVAALLALWIAQVSRLEHLARLWPGPNLHLSGRKQPIRERAVID